MLKNLILLLTFTICGFCLINGQNKGDSIQTKDIQTIIVCLQTNLDILE